MEGKGRGERASLKRDIGWFGAFAMGYADVGADIYVALGIVALYAAGAYPLAFVIAAIVYVMTGLSYAELASTYPYAGGVQTYAMKAFNDAAGFSAGWMMLLAYTVNITLFSMASAGYLLYFLPARLELFGVELDPLIPITLTLIAFLIAVNLIGIRESSAINETLVIPSIIVQAAILVLGLVLVFDLSLALKQLIEVGSPEVLDVSYVPGLPLKGQNFIYGITLAMSSYIGISSIAQAAEETKRPYRWIPLATKMSVIMVIIFALGLSFVSVGMMPWQELANNRESPLIALSSKIPYVGNLLAMVVAVTGFLVNLASANTGVVGVSRVVFSMSKYKQMPGWFYYVHPKYRTPTRSIIFFGLIGMLLTFLGNLEKVADLYTFAALFAYIFVNASLIKLREIDREAYRPWTSPTFKFRGKEYPIAGYLGTLASLALLAAVMIFHHIGRFLGILWLAFGLSLYYVYRRKEGLPFISKEFAEEIKPSSFLMSVLVIVPPGMREEDVANYLAKNLDRRYKLYLAAWIRPDGLTARQIERMREELEGYVEAVAKLLSRKGYEAKHYVIVGGVEEVIEEASDVDLVVTFRRGGLKGKRRGVHTVISSRLPGKVMEIRVR